jgi:hypothetical protein
MKEKPKIDFHFGEVIEIPIPGPADSDPPVWPKSRGEKLKPWINAISIIAALATSITAALKPNDPINKASYEELKKAVEQLNKNDTRNHEDIMAIHSYLESYAWSAASASAAAAQPPPVPPRGRLRNKIVKKKSSKSEKLETPQTPVLPEIHGKPPVQNLPEFDELIEDPDELLK